MSNDAVVVLIMIIAIPIHAMLMALYVRLGEWLLRGGKKKKSE